MSKILDATCDADGKVTVEGVVVTDIEVTSEGKAASTGLVLIDQDRARYITSSAGDIALTIDQVIASLDSLVEVLNKIGTTFTSIGAGMTGITTAPPPTLPTDVSAILASAGELTAIKTELETLKGGLK